MQLATEMDGQDEMDAKDGKDGRDGSEYEDFEDFEFVRVEPYKSAFVFYVCFVVTGMSHE